MVRIILVIFFIWMVQTQPATDVTAEVTKDKYDKLQQEIEIHKEKLKEAQGKERSAVENLGMIDKDLNRISSEHTRLSRQINEIADRSRQLRTDITKKEGALATKKAVIKKRLQALQRYGRTFDKAAILLNAQDIFDIIRMSKYMARMSEYEYQKVLEYRETSDKLAKEDKQLGDLAQELKDKTGNFRQAELNLEKKKKERQDILLAVKKEQALYQSMLNELEATSQRLKGLMEGAQNNMGGSAGKEFKGLKGALPWPVKGKLAIPYGAHEDPTYKTPVFRNGMYISTDPGEVVQAVYDGKVVFADIFKGLGQVIIVNHGNGYHSVYANLSAMYSKVGSVVKRREKIGLAGNSGVLETAGIYFELRYKGKPVNPLQWLTQKN